MGLSWIRENPPTWDDDKQRIVGDAPEGIFELGNYGSEQIIPGQWWRVESDGRAIGYGWMDSVWGDAEILLAVAPEARGDGVGQFILDHLEKEAAAQGLNYLYNIVRPTHPDRDGVTRWLEKRRFTPGRDGERLLRRVGGSD